MTTPPMKIYILTEAAVSGFAFAAGVYILADRHLHWGDALLGLLNLGMAAFNGWTAWRNFDRFYTEMLEILISEGLRFDKALNRKEKAK